MSWYSPGWKFRKKITVQSGQVGGPLSNFPVYVNLADLGAGFFQQLRSDGGDIRVTQTDGVTEVPREIVSFNSGGNTGEMWFQANSVTNSGNTDFYVYYGNPTATDYPTNATFGAQKVWDANFLGVWHGSVNGSSQLVDSTSNANHLANSGGFTNPSGQVGVGITGQFMKGSALSAATDNLTLEAWVNPTSTNILAAAITDGDGTNGIGIDQSQGSGSSGDHVSVLVGGAGWIDTSGRFNPAGSWYHVAAVKSGSVTGYKSGASVSGGSQTMTAPSNFYINGDPNGRSQIGSLDEMRFSNTARSANWILTEYNNMNNTATFYSVASSESIGLGGFIV